MLERKCRRISCKAIKAGCRIVGAVHPNPAATLAQQHLPRIKRLAHMNRSVQTDSMRQGYRPAYRVRQKSGDKIKVPGSSLQPQVAAEMPGSLRHIGHPSSPRKVETARQGKMKLAERDRPEIAFQLSLNRHPVFRESPVDIPRYRCEERTEVGKTQVSVQLGRDPSRTVIGKGVHVHFKTSCQLRPRHPEIETGQTETCGIHRKPSAEVFQHEPALFPEVGRPNTQGQLRSSIEERVYADVHVTHCDVSRIKALTYTADIILVVAEPAPLPVHIRHLIYIVMQQEFGSFRRRFREMGMDAHRVTRQMKRETGSGEMEAVYVDPPQRLLSVWVFGYGVTQGDINPSALDIRFVHTYRIADEIDGMAHNVQPLQVAADTEVTDEVDRIRLQLREGQFVHLYPALQQRQQVDAGHQTAYIGHRILPVRDGIVLPQYPQAVQLEIQRIGQADLIKADLHPRACRHIRSDPLYRPVLYRRTVKQCDKNQKQYDRCRRNGNQPLQAPFHISHIGHRRPFQEGII